MRRFTSAAAVLLCLHVTSAEAADAIGLLKQFDTLRALYPELIDRNLRIVIDATNNRTPEQEARAVADDNNQNIIELSDAFGPVLGPIFANAFDSTGLFSLSLPVTASSLLTSYVTVLSAPIAKEYFKNDRPFKVSAEVKRAEGSSGGGYSYPSGHTTFGYTMMLTLAYIFPERYQEILTRASEYGHNRIVVGVHYPMDVIGGRIISQANVAELIANPLIRLEFNLASLELKNYFAGKCGATAAECAGARADDDLFSNYEQNKADYTYRLTYGLTGTFDTTVPMEVPAGAEWLIASRFPYLNHDQLREVLRSTALPSGDAMLDHANWERLNLFAAADGFGAIETDTRVTMLGEQGGFDLYDRWRNDIGGHGTLIKAGSGWLDLAGDNSFAGVVVEGGTLRLTGDNAFTGGSAVKGASLVIDGSMAAPGGLSVSAGGTLSGTGAVTGAVSIADGTLLPGGDAAGTISLGALDLGADSKVVFDLNQPGVIGGALNDLVEVAGNLDLDGTLDLLSADGVLKPGVYRLFSYGGRLTDHGLLHGEYPANLLAEALALDTSAAHQVNLVVGRFEDGLTFWNGGTTTPDGEIHGGSGTWNATTTNWTDLDGTMSAAWTAMRAVFQGAAGTVTLAGEQAVSGLVFVTDGYRLAPGAGGKIAVAETVDIQVNNGVTAVIAAPISGAGGIAKTDGGLLVLSGINDYRGGTRLEGGTLSVSADGALGDAAGGLAFDGGILQITGTDYDTTTRGITWGARGGGFDIDDGAHRFTIARDLTGGGLLKTGAGALVLAGHNDFSSGIKINDGTLIGDSDSLGGDIVTNADLVFAQGSDGVFADDVGGKGRVTKTGDGTLTVTGNIAAIGGTTIEDGTLRIGDGGTLGALYNAVVNHAVLIFDRADASTFSGTIAGDGTVIKRGDGTLTLTGDSTTTGALRVEAGRLALSGNIADAGVTLESATSITGIGRTGDLTAKAGSTIAPGDASGIGVLRINGDLDIAGGSTFLVDIDDEGDADRIAASGKATIGEGARLAIADMAPGERYRVLTAEQGVEGRFLDLSDDYIFLDATIDYEPTAVTAALERNDQRFADFATGANGKAAAEAAEHLSPGDDLLTSLLTSTAAEAEAAFASMTGEIIADTVAVLAQEAEHVKQAILGRLVDGLAATGDALAAVVPNAAAGTTEEQGRGTLWTAAYGSAASYAGEDGADLDATRAGFLFGADTMIDDGWTLGIAGAIGQTSVEGRPSSGDADLKGYSVALYGGKRYGRFAVRLGAAYTNTRADSTRVVSLPGGGQGLSADYGASTYQAFGDAGYSFRIRGRLMAEPFVNLGVARIAVDDVEESGGSAALAASGLDATTGSSTVGVRFGRTRERGERSLALGGAIGWRHSFGDTETEAAMNFAADPAASFRVDGAPISRDAMALEAGVDYRISRRLELGVHYNGQVSGAIDDHGVQANMKIRF